jgi:hypothetical protein
MKKIKMLIKNIKYLMKHDISKATVTLRGKDLMGVQRRRPRREGAIDEPVRL